MMQSIRYPLGWPVVCARARARVLCGGVRVELDCGGCVKSAISTIWTFSVRFHPKQAIGLSHTRRLNQQ